MTKITAAATQMVEATHHLLPWEHYILDIIYNEEADTASICEYNPWG